MEPYPESFKELNIKKLKRLAQKLAEQYCAIEEIILFYASAHRSYKYVLAVIYNADRAKEEGPGSSAEYYNLSIGDFSFDELCSISHFPQLLDWAWEDCRHIRKDLADAYQDLSSRFRFEDEWAWFSIPSSQGDFNIENDPLLNEEERFVVKENHILLFPEKLATERQEQEAEAQRLAEEKAREKKDAYCFRKVGPTWDIVFEGRPIAGLKEKGWIYIHYLLAHPKKPFTSKQLSTLDGINPEEIGRKKEIEGFQNNQDETHKPFKDEYLNKLKAERESYIGEIQEAERHDNSERASGYKQKLEEHNKVICEYLNSKKPDVEFGLKKATQRVGRAIERAVIELKLYDKQAWSHFDQALRPFRSSPHSYHPTTDLPWIL